MALLVGTGKEPKYSLTTLITSVKYKYKKIQIERHTLLAHLIKGPGLFLIVVI